MQLAYCTYLIIYQINMSYSKYNKEIKKILSSLREDIRMLDNSVKTTAKDIDNLCAVYNGSRKYLSYENIKTKRKTTISKNKLLYAIGMIENGIDEDIVANSLGLSVISLNKYLKNK